MKLLWAKAGKILPLDSGGKLRTYNILRHLAAAHQLSYLSWYRGDRDSAYERELQEHFPGAVTIYTAVREDGALHRYFDYVKRLPASAPYAVTKFTVPEVQRLLKQWISERKFDAAVCDFLSASLNFPDRLETPVVLFQHNVETILWQRKAELEPRWLDRMISRIEYAKMARYEPQQVGRFHHVIAVSEQDKAAMAAMAPRQHIKIVPTGVDLSQFRYDASVQPAGPLVVFTGSMDWEPNIDGVEFFCREVWPAVLTRVPGARFQIVGRHPDPRVQKLASASVEVTGTVPSVVDYLRKAAVIVVPLRIGGGTRIKIYEGMATGKATISTTIGAEGLDVHHGKDIVLADAPEKFAGAIIRLLQDDSERRKYEAAAAETAKKYDWSVIASSFTDVLERVVRGAAVPAEVTGTAPAAV